MEQPGRDILESLRPWAVSARASTGDSAGGTWKTSAAAATPVRLRKGPPCRSHAPLQQFHVGAPMERVAVDVVGPLPRSEKGNRYVLSAIDYFTKWPEAYAIPDQEAETVVDALVGGMFSHFGVPETLHSDQGRNFESKVFASMCKRLGIHKTRTTPLRPQSDGLVERFHRTLGQQLAILTSKHQWDWDDHLPLVLMSCRSAVQETTSCTPTLRMLGRELRTSAELAFVTLLTPWLWPRVGSTPVSFKIASRRRMLLPGNSSFGLERGRNVITMWGKKGGTFKQANWCGFTIHSGRRAVARSWTAHG